MKSSTLSTAPRRPDSDDRSSSFGFYLLMAALVLGLAACIVLPFTL